MKLLPSKKLFFNFISVSILCSITLGAIFIVLHSPISVLNAQTLPTSYWNVERDGSNYLNFSFTNNNNPGIVGLRLLPSGVVNSPGSLTVGSSNTNPSQKLLINTTSTNDGINIQGANNTWAAFLANLGGGSYNGMSGAGDRGIIFGGVSAGNPGGGFVIAPWSNSPSGLKVSTGGNVGLGNNNPGQKLHVGMPTNSFGASDGIIRTSTVTADGNGSRSWDFGSGVGTFGNYGFNIADVGNGPPAFNIAYGTKNVGIGTTSPTQKLDVAGTVKATRLESPGAVIDIGLNYCSGACASYHAQALNNWFNVSAAGYTWAAAQNTATDVFSHNGAGTITVLKAGLYEVKLRSMAMPVNDIHNVVVVITCINGNPSSWGNSGNTYYKHQYHKAGWWAQETTEMTVNLDANTTIQYCYLYNDPAGLSYWAHDGYTSMQVTRIN